MHAFKELNIIWNHVLAKWNIVLYYTLCLILKYYFNQLKIVKNTFLLTCLLLVVSLDSEFQESMTLKNEWWIAFLQCGLTIFKGSLVCQVSWAGFSPTKVTQHPSRESLSREFKEIGGRGLVPHESVLGISDLMSWLLTRWSVMMLPWSPS